MLSVCGQAMVMVMVPLTLLFLHDYWVE